jgi:hypothetical protein
LKSTHNSRAFAYIGVSIGYSAEREHLNGALCWWLVFTLCVRFGGAVVDEFQQALPLGLRQRCHTKVNQN